ncbi:MAG: hypothetical protein EAZ81_01515 [Verrucomicrobia bacterium]|nr:MAG: hypothetical protein EAZ81_01515 [Verrucomicrobiota bacterium]
MLQELILWQDAVARDGPLNMAIDDWLWNHAARPILRVYGWLPQWVSIGYFSQWAQLPEATTFVRRPTGGGLVEHGSDWPYTLVIPRGWELAEMPGAESYRVIHQALEKVLVGEGVDCRLTEQAGDEPSDLCFRHPVVHDVIAVNGTKLAGAGQRRGKSGLLHQGSLRCESLRVDDRGRRFAEQLALAVKTTPPTLDWDWIHQRAAELYASSAWNRKK